jgi:hypothetical protein
MGRRRRRRNQLLDDLKETERMLQIEKRKHEIALYRELPSEEAVDLL